MEKREMEKREKAARWMRAAVLGFAVVGALIAGSSEAAEYYRKNSSYRPLGGDQGSEGSCAAEAQVAAIESVFALKGLPVLLSPYYRHAKNWFGAAPDEQVHQDYLPEDAALFARGGGFVPDYMYPEDARYMNAYRNSRRPSISKAALIDPEYRNMESFGLQDVYYTFRAGYSNTRSLEQMKADVAGDRAVSVHIDSGIFYDPCIDHRTGLFRCAYDSRRFATPTIHHDVAVVGFDDSFYAGAYAEAGAIFVRNSWNDDRMVDEALAMGPDPLPVQQDLARFRGRLNSLQNLPGYYAIPIAYFRQLLASDRAGYEAFDLDYGGYADQYARLQQRYETLRVPFFCKNKSLFPGYMAMRIAEYKRNADAERNPRAAPEARRKAADAIRKMAYDEIRAVGLRRNFIWELATIPTHRSMGVDQVRRFYGGELDSFYCGSIVDDGRKIELLPAADRSSDSRIDGVIQLLTYAPYELRSWIAFYDFISR